MGTKTLGLIFACFFSQNVANRTCLGITGLSVQPGSLEGGSGWEQSVELCLLGEELWFVFILLGWGRMSALPVLGSMG